VKHVETVALIPLNQLAAAKSRLSPALPASERRALVLWMAGRVLAAVRDSERVVAIGVVSPDPEVLEWAERRGALPVRQLEGDLNAGLELGRSWAQARGADALLVLLGDLPCLATCEVRDFVALAETAAHGGPLVALAPDRHERGTNGLLLRPVDALPFAFGEGSLARHEALARERGIATVRFHARGLRYDVDTPADLRDVTPFEDDDARLTPAEPHGKLA
jgi:2-phospho-L-lactate/phosphoenolpyruvate guanylyltransferase